MSPRSDEPKFNLTSANHIFYYLWIVQFFIVLLLTQILMLVGLFWLAIMLNNLEMLKDYFKYLF